MSAFILPVVIHKKAQKVNGLEQTLKARAGFSLNMEQGQAVARLGELPMPCAGCIRSTQLCRSWGRNIHSSTNTSVLETRHADLRLESGCEVCITVWGAGQ